MSDISPELVERMAQALRAYVSDDPALRVDSRFNGLRLYDEMLAIVALLPVPVDPDLIEARAISLKYALPAQLHGLASSRVRGGEADATTSVEAILTAIKRGRELERRGA